MHGIKPLSAHILTLSDGRSISLLESLGQGRYGRVHRSFVESGWGVRRPVAVKLIDLSPDQDHGEIMRVLGRIARRAACIRHPSVIQLLEVDRTDRLAAEPCRPFLVSELVEGESLASLVESWRSSALPVPNDFALVVVLRVAEALGAALFTEGPDGALTGLVHGDLSLRQILVSNQGEVKVGDFGQLSLAGGSHVRARHDLSFAAPEVVWGSPPDARSDVFSLGVLLHELLVGPRFTRGTSTRDAMAMIRDGRVGGSAAVLDAFRPLLARATAPNPDHRYPHARALASELRHEMQKLGLADPQTCVRHAIVGWSDPEGSNEHPIVLRDDEVEEVEPEELLETPAPGRQYSDVVPRGGGHAGLEDPEDALPAFLFDSSRKR